MTEVILKCYCTVILLPNHQNTLSKSICQDIALVFTKGAAFSNARKSSLVLYSDTEAENYSLSADKTEMDNYFLTVKIVAFTCSSVKP